MYTPLVSEGQEDGSTASARTFLPAIFSATKGKAMPAKFEPPPWQAITTSGSPSPASLSCSLASWPMTVWCMQTWFSTEPRA